MTAGNVAFLPNWKKGATPEEFFQECAVIARVNPDWCKRVVVVVNSDDGEMMKHRVWRHEVTTLETLGMLELGKLRFMDET